MLAKGAISWYSRMQEVTAAGTSEAEYVGGRVRCLIGGSQGCTIFETGAVIHGTVDEGRCGKCI